jgi:hypothetical protein
MARMARMKNNWRPSAGSKRVCEISKFHRHPRFFEAEDEPDDEDDFN